MIRLCFYLFSPYQILRTSSVNQKINNEWLSNDREPFWLRFRCQNTSCNYEEKWVRISKIIIHLRKLSNRRPNRFPVQWWRIKKYWIVFHFLEKLRKELSPDVEGWRTSGSFAKKSECFSRKNKNVFHISAKLINQTSAEKKFKQSVFWSTTFYDKKFSSSRLRPW